MNLNRELQKEKEEKKTKQNIIRRFKLCCDFHIGQYGKKYHKIETKQNEKQASRCIDATSIRNSHESIEWN